MDADTVLARIRVQWKIHQLCSRWQAMLLLDWSLMVLGSTLPDTEILTTVESHLSSDYSHTTIAPVDSVLVAIECIVRKLMRRNCTYEDLDYH